MNGMACLADLPKKKREAFGDGDRLHFATAPDPSAGQGVMQAFRRANSICESARLKLRGLDARARCARADLDKSDAPKEFTGSELTETGLLVTARGQPAAVVLTYRRVP